MKTKKIILTAILIAITLILSGEGVQAALQANPNTQSKKTDTLANWVKNVRKMEEADGAMGLGETIDSTTLLATSNSNGIDVHCVKTTEYGAMAILSASGYGNPSNERVITTTTGNNTGVILNTSNHEWTSGIRSVSGAGLTGVNARYYDLYTSSSDSAKRGDALGSETAANPGCAGWHSASDSIWLSNASDGFLRGGGGIFSFSSYHRRLLCSFGCGLWRWTLKRSVL